MTPKPSPRALRSQSQHSQGTTLVEDSFKDRTEAKQAGQPHASTTAPTGEDEDEDLYGISPGREALRTISATQPSRGEKTEEADDDINYSRAGTVAKAALDLHLDVSNGNHVAQGIFPAHTPPAKLKLLTQRTSEADTIQPAFEKSGAVKSTMSSNSRGGQQSSTSLKAGPTSQRSAMVSAHKGGLVVAPPPDSTQSVGKKSALDALRERKGLAGKSQPAQSVQQAVELEPAASNNQPQTASPVKKTAKGTAAIKNAAREKQSQGKNAVSASTKSQDAVSPPTQKRRSLRETMQVETSRTKTTDSPDATQPGASTHRPMPDDPYTAPQEEARKGKLKKPSLTGKGKGKRPVDNAADSDATDRNAVSKSKKAFKPEPPPAKRQFQHSERDDDNNEDDEEEPSQPRKRGKGALPSNPKQATRTRRRPNESSQIGEPDSDFELISSPKKAHRKKKFLAPQAPKKSAPKAKAAAASTTVRTTRAQAPAAQKSQSDLADSEEVSSAPADTKGAKKPQKKKSATADIPPTRAADQSDELNDNAAEVDEEVAPQEKTSLSKDKPKASGLPKVTAQRSPQKPATRASPRLKKPGGTQENAIELSDRIHSSSPLPPTSARETEEPVQNLIQEDSPSRNTRSRTHARTPANVPSSPPVQSRYDEGQVDPVTATARSRKTNIIGFSKDGPLNQGISKGKTPGSRSARGNLSPMRSTKLPLAFADDGSKMNATRRKRASSVATTARTRKTAKSAAPSNVADDVGDALAGLKGKANVAEDVGDALAGLKKRVPRDPLTASAPQQKIAAAIEPRPEEDDGGFIPIDDYEETTLVEPDVQEAHSLKPLSFNRSASQLAMPPPPAKTPEKSMMSAMITTQDDADGSAPSESVPKSSRVKRMRDPEPTAERATKRSQASETYLPRQEIATAKASVAAGKAKNIAAKEDTPIPAKGYLTAVKSFQDTSLKRAHGAEAQIQFSAKRVKLDPQQEEERPVKAPAISHESMANRASSSKREIRAGRRTVQRRQTSQNSQTVDMGGSPVPPDIEVTGKATVLETFSQQARLSSDVSSELPMAWGQHFDHTRTRSQRSDESNAYRPPPSHQAGVLSSNIKPRPAAPEAESAIIPRVSLRDLQDLNRRSPLAVEEDPFNSSQEDDQVPDHQAPFMSHLAATTKKFDGLSDRFQRRDPVKSNSNFFARARSPSRRSPPAPVVTNEYIKSTQKQYDQLRKMARPRRHVQEEEEDPDKTLVNEDEEHYAAAEVEDEQHVLDGYDQDEEEEYNVAADEMDLSDDDPDDLMSWRKTLCPHQLNLFEELIKCSHRITQFFSEQENNIERTLAEQHEMNLHVIEQDELIRAKKYEQLKEKLSRAKLETKRDIKLEQEQMKKSLSARAKEKSSRIIAAGLKEQANKELEALLERLESS